MGALKKGPLIVGNPHTLYKASRSSSGGRKQYH